MSPICSKIRLRNSLKSDVDQRTATDAYVDKAHAFTVTEVSDMVGHVFRLKKALVFSMYWHALHVPHLDDPFICLSSHVPSRFGAT